MSKKFSFKSQRKSKKGFEFMELKEEQKIPLRIANVIAVKNKKEVDFKIKKINRLFALKLFLNPAKYMIDFIYKHLIFYDKDGESLFVNDFLFVDEKGKKSKNNKQYIIIGLTDFPRNKE